MARSDQLRFVGVLLPYRLFVAIAKVALENNTTMSNVIRYALNKFVEEYDKGLINKSDIQAIPTKVSGPIKFEDMREYYEIIEEDM